VRAALLLLEIGIGVEGAAAPLVVPDAVPAVPAALVDAAIDELEAVAIDVDEGVQAHLRPVLDALLGAEEEVPMAVPAEAESDAPLRTDLVEAPIGAPRLVIEEVDRRPRRHG